MAAARGTVVEACLKGERRGVGEDAAKWRLEEKARFLGERRKARLMRKVGLGLGFVDWAAAKVDEEEGAAMAAVDGVFG